MSRPEAPEEGARGGPWPLVALALLVTFAALGPGAWRQALWTDELFTVVTAALPPGEMLRKLGEYHPGYFDHPPLFFLLLRPVLLVSEHPFVLRIPVLLSMGLAVGVTAALIARETGSRAAAFIAVPLMVWHAEVWELGQFVRSYALVALLGAGIAWLALELLREGDRGRMAKLAAGISALLAVALWTTYFSLVLVASVGAAGVALAAYGQWRERELREPGAALAGAAAASALPFLPWAPTVLRLMSQEKEVKVPFAEALGLAARAAAECFGSWWMLALLAAAVAAGARPRREHLFLVAMLLLGPLLLIALQLPEGRTINLRYVVYALPAGMVMAAMLLAEAAERVAKARALPRRAMAAVVAVAVAAALWQGRRASLPDRDVPDWWAAAETVESQYLPGEIVVTGTWLSGEAMEYHMRAPERIRFVHHITTLDPFYLACRDPRVVWYVGIPFAMPEAYAKILRRYFPYRAEFAGNGPLGPILVASKKPFAVPGVGPATQHEPIPLEYEQQLAPQP